MVFGTRQDTYRAPGITSQLSKNRQNGDLEIVTSDAAGNLATDGGDTFKHFEIIDKRLDRTTSASTRISLASRSRSRSRILTWSATSGSVVAMNYGNFEGASALSWSAMGVLGYDVLSRGDRVAVSGGFGVGFEEDSGDDVWGGRVGAQWTWGRKPVPYILK